MTLYDTMTALYCSVQALAGLAVQERRMPVLKESALNKIQEKICYQFKNKKLLSQAFTRKSFSSCNGGEDNEVLEFYGDRVLDFAVIKDFFDLHGRINNNDEFVSSKTVGELSKDDCSLVKNINLAGQISRLGFSKYLQVEKSYEKSCMKVRADLFEAILGAVALDSNWDIRAISSVFHAMMYGRDVKDQENFIPDEYIDLFVTELWKLNVFKSKTMYLNSGNGCTCQFLLDLNGQFVKVQAFGSTSYLADIAASEKGYKLLVLLVERKFIDGMSYNEQLFFLSSFGLLGEPRFRYELYPAGSGNHADLWRCFGGLADSDLEYESEAETMFEAKEQVSYAILCNTLGIVTDEFEIEGCTDDKRKLDTQASDNVISFQSPAPEVRGQGLFKYIISHYEATA